MALTKRIRTVDKGRRRLLKQVGAVGAAIAAGATGSAAVASAAPIRRAAAPAVVRYAHMNCWDATLCRGQKDLVAEFNATHPNIRAESVEWSWGNYLATMSAAVTAGEAPDVMHVGWGEVVSLGRPYFEPLDAYLTDDLKQNIRPSSWTSSQFDGQTYGIPVTEQLNEVAYYRSDIWQQAGIDGEPTTWEQFTDVAQRLMAAGLEGDGTQASGAPITARFIELQYQNGSNMFVPIGGGKWAHTLDTPESMEAGRFWHSIWRSGILSQSNLQRSSNELEPAFAAGTLGMMHGIVQSYFSMVETYPELADKIRLLPPLRRVNGATVGGAFSLSMFKQARNKDAAAEFISWATTADTMNRFWIPNGHILPTRVDVRYPAMPDYIQQRFGEYQAVQRVFPFVPEWETVKGKVLTPILGDMATGAVDFDTGWNTLISQTNFVLS
jgi:multiple sugar transport system substrate-binding protein